MERTVPSASSEEIKLYRSTIYSLLRSTTEVQIRTLEEIHAGMNSLLHYGARGSQPDISAFIYSVMRLPGCLPQVRSVILGQSTEVFQRNGFPQVREWQPVSARARRRRCFFDGKDTLACFIASRSDIEDVVPALTAYQIEWNKMHLLLQSWPREISLLAAVQDPKLFVQLADTLAILPEDLDRLRVVWGENFLENLRMIQERGRSIGVRLLNGSLSQYMRATHDWWENIERVCSDISQRPVYFVSSNTHSVANLLTGFPLQYERSLIQYVERSGDPDLLQEWKNIGEGNVRSSRENYLYYVGKKFQQTEEGAAMLEAQNAYERAHGVLRINSEQSFDMEAQVFDLSQIDPAHIDTRLNDSKDMPGGKDMPVGKDMPGGAFPRGSDALILNIDYPLGLGAFNILSKVSEQAGSVLGVYVMGKSAALNAVRGDVLIPNVVQDEHSHNTYLFNNNFSASDVAPYLRYGTVLDNQKAISVLGTFLQNATIMDVFFREGYADIEMESGPFLSAAYEMYRPKRHPIDEIVNLYGLPFDLGILHYVSDTPLSKGKNLGAGTLSYFGMDSTYAATLAILRRILQVERARLKQ